MKEFRVRKVEIDFNEEFVKLSNSFSEQYFAYFDLDNIMDTIADLDESYLYLFNIIADMDKLLKIALINSVIKYEEIVPGELAEIKNISLSDNAIKMANDFMTLQKI